MQQHLLTIVILLPVIGALAMAGYGFAPNRREEHYRWIAFAFSTATFLLSLLLIRGAGAGLADVRLRNDSCRDECRRHNPLFARRVLVVSGFRSGLLHQGAAVSAAHVAARCAYGSADRRLGDSCRCAA